MTLPSGFTISLLEEPELPQLAQWAQEEGWNPGRHDLTLAWNLQREAFVALRHHNALVGAGTIFRHDPGYGFMGFFIVDGEYRGRGLGSELWHYRRDALKARLARGGIIGMDGVPDLVPFYTKGGFTPTYRSVRMQGTARTGRSNAVALTVRDLPEIERLDQPTFPVGRAAFLTSWMSQEHTVVRGVRRDGDLVAWAMARPCATGFKLGPVVALNPSAAEEAILGVTEQIVGQQIQIDVPEVNHDAFRVAEGLGLTEVFSCTRLYLGGIPVVDTDRIYGVTSFEFG